MEKTRLKVILWTAGALVCCLLVAAVTAWQVDHYNRQVADGEVEEAAEDAANAVISRLNLYQYGLRGSRGAVLTAGENISRELFRRYSQSRDLNREFPGARGFGFIRRVSVKSEARFLASARADDWPEFNIHQLSPHEGERFVIQYIEPIESNIQAIGLDIASETNRREAAWAAMRTGEVHLTGPITLVQATGLPFQSFLILMPIYRDVAVPTTVAAREKAAVGWTYAPLVMKDVLGGLGLERAGTHLELKDITVPGHVESFFHSLDTEPNIAGTLTHSLERDVFGRRWEFQFSAQPSFVDKLNLLSPTWVMTLGTFFSVLVAALVGMAVSSFERRRQFLVEQARLAAIVESSGDGIIGKTLQGVVTSWNKAAERIFGYSAEEAIGRSLAHLVVPRDLWHEEDDILARVGRGEQITNFTTRRQHRDGGFLDVSVTVSPIRDASGKVVGASKTARDISVQKATERRIHELNVNLEAQVAQRTAELTRVNHLIASVLSAATEVSIIATDSDGTIRLFNRGAERMFGYLAEDMVGQRNILELHVSNEIRARGEELSERLRHEVDGIRVLAEMPASQAAETREWTLVRRGGAVFPAMVAVTAMRDDAGQTGGLLAVAVDISVQNRQRSELLATRDQLAMAAEVAGLGIWTWVLADDSLHWNPRMFQIYNYPLSMGMGGLEFSSWHRRIHPDDVQMMMDSLTAAVEGRGTFDVIFRIVLPEGGVRYIQASAQVERDDHQVPIQVTGINLDITDQQEVESRLKHAKEQADLANESKSSFLANMSHEIRTPMNAVLGLLQLVRQTDLSLRQQDYLDKALGSAKSLLSLLNDILDYSKIEARKFELDLRPFELETLMADLGVVLAGNQGQKNVEIVFDMDPALPSSLVGDVFRIKQVLINLAGNAFKFTEQGQVIIGVQELERTGDSSRLRFWVEDTGIGISASQQERIFDGFTQAEASTARRFGGTGLGLAISQRMVNLMQGRLNVSSVEGEGSRFWFDISLQIAKPTSIKANCPGADVPFHVLIADDNPVALELLVRSGRAIGWRVDQAADAYQAVALARSAVQNNDHFDAVLLDWRMPGMDGDATIRQMQQLNGGRPLPLIILATAYGREALARLHHAISSQFFDLLAKPVTPRQLAECVVRTLAGASRVVAARSVPTPSLRRLAGLRLLVVEDNAINRQVVAELLEQEGAEVRLAMGGLEGVSMVQSNPGSFDVIIMDMQMPDVDGLEATRRIRADSRFRQLPILAMTANASVEDRNICLAAGMTDHVGKPIDLELVVAKLCELAGYETCAAKDSAKADDKQPSPVEVESLTSILSRFGGNRDLLQRTVMQFEADQRKLLDQLRGHIQARDVAGSAAVLHGIKGSAGTLGASALAKRATLLESQLKSASAEDAARLLNQNWAQELSDLLSSSQRQLKAMLVSNAVPASPISAAQNAWLARLNELLPLLEAGNMRAVDMVETLTPEAGDPLQERFLAQVQALEFPAAVSTLRKLLDVS